MFVHKMRSLFGRLASAGGLFGLSIVAVLGAVAAGIGFGQLVTAPSQAPTTVAAVSESQVLQDGSDWLSEGYWKRRREKKQRQQARRQNSFERSNLGARINPFSETRPAARKPARRSAPPQSTGTYRTVCVRLCDGYYFPISFSTVESRFGADEQACQSRCSSGARLYYYKNSDGSPETMKDRQGRAYQELNTAFLYRTSYEKSCQCRADPWSDSEKQRHATYRAKGWKKRARRLAKLEKRRARVAARKARREQRRLRQAGVSLQAPTSSADDEAGAQFAGTVNQRAPRRETAARSSRVSTDGRMSLGQRQRVKASRRPRSRPRVVSRQRKRAWKRSAFGGGDN